MINPELASLFDSIYDTVNTQDSKKENKKKR